MGVKTRKRKSENPPPPMSDILKIKEEIPRCCIAAKLHSILKGIFKCLFQINIPCTGDGSTTNMFCSCFSNNIELEFTHLLERDLRKNYIVGFLLGKGIPLPWERFFFLPPAEHTVLSRLRKPSSPRSRHQLARRFDQLGHCPRTQRSTVLPLPNCPGSSDVTPHAASLSRYVNATRKINRSFVQVFSFFFFLSAKQALHSTLPHRLDQGSSRITAPFGTQRYPRTRSFT